MIEGIFNLYFYFYWYHYSYGEIIYNFVEPVIVFSLHSESKKSQMFIIEV